MIGAAPDSPVFRNPRDTLCLVETDLRAIAAPPAALAHRCRVPPAAGLPGQLMGRGLPQ